MIKTFQRGFTLIELVVVIVILGILAAYAVPRFMGMETEARISTVKSMGGTLQSTAAMAHGICIARNCGNAANINVSGQPIVFANQYPDIATIGLLLESLSGFTVANNNGGRQFTKTGAITPARCWVQYNAAAAPGVAPVVGFPTAAGNGMQVIGVNNATDATVDAVLRANC